MMKDVPVAWSQSNAAEKAYEIKRLQDLGAPPSVINKVRDIDLDNWNKGTLNWIDNLTDSLDTPARFKTPRNKMDLVSGIASVRDSGDFLDFAEKMHGAEKSGIQNRAQNFLKASRKGKARLAEKIIQEARKAKERSRGASSIYNILGGALLAGGGGLALSGILDKLKRKKEQNRYENY
jgi:hypothetical protein